MHDRMQEESIAEQVRYEEKDEAYFSYYAMLTHQAQMLQDSVTTSAYQMAILKHADPFFEGRCCAD